MFWCKEYKKNGVAVGAAISLDVNLVKSKEVKK